MVGGGNDFDRYVPAGQRLKFMRYQIADFVESEANTLADLSYDQLVERKWIKLAHSVAKANAIERAARTHR